MRHELLAGPPMGENGMRAAPSQATAVMPPAMSTRGMGMRDHPSVSPTSSGLMQSPAESVIHDR
jgi:hypothetical protein